MVLVTGFIGGRTFVRGLLASVAQKGGGGISYSITIDGHIIKHIDI